MRVRVAAVWSIGLVLVGLAGPAWADIVPGGTFFDDDGDVHEADIEAIAAAGVTRGCGGDLYCPDRTVTRGEMAAFLSRALGLPSDRSDVFSDDDESVFEGDIDALSAAGITAGCGPGVFCPDRPVTRGEMAAFLARAFDLERRTDEFTDTAGSIFRSDIGALAMADITLGCNPPANDRFCPDEPVRRNQMASFLRRAMGLEPIAVPARPTVTLAFTGDTLIHLTVTTQAARDGARRGVRFDFGPMLDRVRPLVEPADLALCHLEVPLDPTSTGVSGYPLFNAPAEVADGLADIGFDGCSTASNHSLDQGIEGILDTLEVLERRGLGSAGMFADQQTAGAATRYRLDDLDVAHLSATFSLNGLRLPAGREWMVQRIVEDQILTAAADARRSGADFVILSLHCCTEYQTPPTPFQRQVARRLIGSPDIDLIVGHHAHVIQPVEQVGDEYIVYGLGNFLSGQQFEPRVSDGVVVYADISPRGEHWSVREISAAPTRVVDGSYRIVPVSAATASWHRTMGTLRALGVEVEAR